MPAELLDYIAIWLSRQGTILCFRYQKPACFRLQTRDIVRTGKMIYDVPVSQCHEHWTTWTHRLLVVAGNVFRKFYVLDCLAPPVSTYFTFRPAVGPPDLLLHRGENIQTKRSYENQPETRMIRHGLDVGVPAIRGFIRQPLSTSCVGLAQGCNPLASAVFFGAYLCSDQLSCESLLE